MTSKHPPGYPSRGNRKSSSFHFMVLVEWHNRIIGDEESTDPTYSKCIRGLPVPSSLTVSWKSDTEWAPGLSTKQTY